MQLIGTHRNLQIYKSQLLIALLIFLSINSSGQMKRFEIKWNLSDSIKMIYNKYLLPPTNGTDMEVVSFWSNYDNQPEYTIRITKGEDNQHYLEGRFLTLSIGEIAKPLIEHPETKSLSINVKLFSTPVSNTLMLNLRSAFVKIKDCKKLENVYVGPWALDGVCFNFRINNGNNEILESSLYEPEESNPCYKTIVLCKQMANDLKNKTFQESKYIDQFK